MQKKLVPEAQIVQWTELKWKGYFLDTYLQRLRPDASQIRQFVPDVHGWIGRAAPVGAI